MMDGLQWVPYTVQLWLEGYHMPSGTLVQHRTQWKKHWMHVLP